MATGSPGLLDTFIVGRVTRISPEAPVPVVAFDHEMHRIGGAANVAHNIAALGGEATLLAVTGQDDAAAFFGKACRDAGITASLVGDASRRTTAKVRVVTDRNQQVALIDYESDAEIAGDIQQRVIAEISQHAAREVADVTGAGDTVIAALALSLASGATLAEAARIANEAAGIVVGKFGPATVTVPELLRVFDSSAIS